MREETSLRKARAAFLPAEEISAVLDRIDTLNSALLGNHVDLTMPTNREKTTVPNELIDSGKTPGQMGAVSVRSRMVREIPFTGGVKFFSSVLWGVGANIFERGSHHHPPPPLHFCRTDHSGGNASQSISK